MQGGTSVAITFVFPFIIAVFVFRVIRILETITLIVVNPTRVVLMLNVVITIFINTSVLLVIFIYLSLVALLPILIVVIISILVTTTPVISFVRMLLVYRS